MSRLLMMPVNPRNRRRAGSVALLLLALGAAGLLGLQAVWRWRRGSSNAGPLPTPLPQSQTPSVALAFDFPLDPAHFGPYIPYVSGDFAVDTRFAVQNPGVGNAGKCFVALSGERVPFAHLYHAGEDWFALTETGKVDGHGAAGAPVQAIGDGQVSWLQALGSDGHVLILEHTLPDGEHVWSVYWHVAQVQVAPGEAVNRGQTLAVVHDRGLNSHLHWEVRTFADGSALFTADSAGGRGACNGYVAGVGYTWDDDPQRAMPQAWGYLAPTDFINTHRGASQN